MRARTLLLVVVAILGFLSSLLGFIAEGKKLAENDVIRLPSDVCTHRRGPAMVLGTAAAILLLVAQVISNSLGGCICCESGISEPCGKGTPTAVAIGFLTFSWITFSIAFLLFVAGASVNDRRDISDDNYSYGCYVLKSGVFTGAAFASMTTAVLGIVYNLQVLSIRKTMTPAPRVVSSMDMGRMPSALVTNNGNLRQGRTSQDRMATASPVFPSVQRQKSACDRSAYPRGAVHPKRESRLLEMARRQSEGTSNDLQESARTRSAPEKLEADGIQASNHMRNSFDVQQQGYSIPDNKYCGNGAESNDDDGTLDAGQSAAAAYRVNGSGSSEYEIEEEASRPLYRRAVEGSIWEK